MKTNNGRLWVLAVSAVLTLASCGGGSTTSSSTASSEASSSAPAKYERGDDDAIYEEVLGEFEDLVEEAHKIYEDDARYIKYAEAEGELLAQGLMVPTYTQGGTYSISRAAPKTVSAAVHGIDSDRLQYLVATTGEDKFVKATERAELKEKWQAAKDANDSSKYDPATYLKGKGYTLATEYTTTDSAFPQTLDVLATYRAADTEYPCNGIEGLVEYDNVGVLRGAMAVENADGTPYTISSDGLTYTFKIRDDAWWVDDKGAKVAKVTADDFVAGMQHALDAQGGLEYLVSGVIKNASEYMSGKATWDKVGYQASSDGTSLIITLTQKESYFPSRLVYSVFMPMNRSFYESKGGKFGSEFNSEAESYKYGKSGDPTSILYNSAFYCTKYEDADKAQDMVYTKNPFFYNADKVTLNKIHILYDDGSNPEQIYADARKGTYVGVGLSASTGLLKKAKDDNLFNDYAYITDTNATTYFGGLNLNRGAWSLESGGAKSSQSEEQKILNHVAFNNKNFRLGFLHGFDRATWNDVRCGEGVGKYGLRNMYTYPDFVKLSAATKDGENHEFAANTSYGDLVEYYANKKGANVADTADGKDGWYNLTQAKKELAAAKKELGTSWPEGMKVHIDKVYYSGSPAQVSQFNAMKKIVEEAIGDYVVIDGIEVTTTSDYYYSGYYCETGEELPQDYFDGSGWGPDYLDPGTYLDTFSALRDASMVKVIGLDPSL
ncbi:MAG: hypothetical protein K6B65_02740 [Bacilli bacterium]|nr:hypothetical protein [Bacilli bacterium]